MEVIKLTEDEQQCYGKLFTNCSPDNSGCVSWSKASELFLTSRLPLETLSKITDLCGVKRVGQFKRSQFYVALRLIAAAQNGHSIESESLPPNIPLPSFSKADDKDSKMQEEQVLKNDVLNNSNAFTQQSQKAPGVILPPPPNNRGRTMSQPVRPTNFKHADNEASIVSNQVPEAVVHNSASTPTSPNIPDKTWVPFSKSDNQPNWMQFEEHHQLLSAEDDSSERRSSSDGDQDNNDDDDDDDPFTLTDELRRYYTDQFKALQPDLESVIRGNAVKQFFEQSGLANHELSKIWQLADVDRDGALSLEEFFIAMHLVVIRRNKIDLPEVLPPSLLPQALRKGHSSSVTSPTSPDAAASLLKDKQWTKFNDSPVSSVSSPSMKPVNFDFPSAAVEQDPKILHPVPLRLSPDQMIQDESIKLRTASEPVGYKPLQNDPSSSPTNCKSPSHNVQTQAIQRPTPRKPSGAGAIPPPPQALATTVLSPADGGSEDTRSTVAVASSYSGPTFHVQPKKEPPPPPPPRPKRNHARSSSLDLNRLGTPPAVPPRISPGIVTPKKLVNQQSEPCGSTQAVSNFADFTKFEADKDSSDQAADDNEDSLNRQRHLSAPLLSQKAKETKDKKDLLAAIKAYRQSINVLSRLSSELNQELTESMEERIALEIQLETLKPFTS